MESILEWYTELMSSFSDLLKSIWKFIRTNDAVLVGVVGGITAMIWQTIRTNVEVLWDWTKGKFVYEVSINNETDLYDAMNSWYYENHSKAFREVSAGFNETYKDGKTKYKLIYNPITSMRIIKIDGKKIFLKKTTEEVYHPDNPGKIRHMYVLTSLFDSKTINGFLEYLEVEWNKSKSGMKGIPVIIKQSYHTETMYRSTYKSFDSLFFEGKDKLIKYLNKFVTKKAIYGSKGIRYKISILLEGIPGSGKSECAFAIADHLNRPIYYIAPNTFSNDGDFQDYVEKVEPGSIILMEDVDNYFGNRKSKDSVPSKTALSFTSILNTMDGLFSPEDVVIVMTTNHPEELDDALLRKGRVDFRLHLGKSDKKNIAKYLQFYYNLPILVEELQDVVLMPMVDVEHICKESETLEEALVKLKEYESNKTSNRYL